MTTPEVSCKAVAMQNSSQWPCSLCPIPQLRVVWVRTSYIYIYIYIFLIFPEHPEFWTPLQIPIWAPPPWLHTVTLRCPANSHVHKQAWKHIFQAQSGLQMMMVRVDIFAATS